MKATTNQSNLDKCSSRLMSKEFKNSIITTSISNSLKINQSDTWKKHLNPQINKEYHKLKLGYGLKRTTNQNTFSFKKIKEVIKQQQGIYKDKSPKVYHQQKIKPFIQYKMTKKIQKLLLQRILTDKKSQKILDMKRFPSLQFLF